MNLCNDKGSMSTVSSSVVVSDQFPAGLRVLVVDDDPTCLRILEKMLRTCLYEVTKCNRAETALNLLRGNKNGYDIVISDVHMPDIDGFKLLEQVGLEMDLPVIMMSADASVHVVMKGVTHGACDYLIKPVRIEELKNIWQYVVRKRKNEWKDMEQSGYGTYPIGDHKETTRGLLKDRKDEVSTYITDDLEKMIPIINFVLELASAVFDQLSSVHKLQYAIVSMSLSFGAMFLCIVELVHKCRNEKIAWKWRSILPWLYYAPRNHSKPFGNFKDIIGLIFAICQCTFAIINFDFARRHADNPVKISFWPIVFALGILCSKYLENPGGEDVEFEKRMK